MKRPLEPNPLLRLIDVMLGDIAVGVTMYVARRGEAGGDETFVIQYGEDGRMRLALPDPISNQSIQTLVADAQARLAAVLGQPAPSCPLHEHALLPNVSVGQLRWLCPHGGWQCDAGEYAESAWPQFEHDKLAPILSGRLERRGITGVGTIAVRATERGPVAEFGIRGGNPELTRALQDAASPLPVTFHPDSRQAIRV